MLDPILDGRCDQVWTRTTTAAAATTTETETTTNQTIHDPNCHIYLGAWQSADFVRYSEWMQQTNVGGIINCTMEKIMIPTKRPHRIHPNCDDDDGKTDRIIRFAQVPIHDEIGADLLSYLPGATAFLHTCLYNNKDEDKHIGVNNRNNNNTSLGHSVLVHCMVGVSRSASVVLAYLMEYQGMSLNQAVQSVRHHRPIIQPNRGFWNQLLEYERRCRSPNNFYNNSNNNNNNHQADNKDGGTGTYRLLLSSSLHHDVIEIHNAAPTTIMATTTTTTTIKDEHNNCSNWIRQSTAIYATCRDIRTEFSGNFWNQLCGGPLIHYWKTSLAATTTSSQQQTKDDTENNNGPEQTGNMDNTIIVSMEIMLCMALDYIWGRGVLQVEVDWLAHVLCPLLDDQAAATAAHASMTTTTKEPSLPTTAPVAAATTLVERMLLHSDNPEDEASLSKFRQDWAGELHPAQIGRVLTTLFPNEGDNDDNDNCTENDDGRTAP